jgi:hypothetical protein
MTKLERTLTIICLLIIIFLVGYTYSLTKRIETQELRLVDLERNINGDKSDSDIDNNIQEYKKLIDELNSDFSKKKELSEEPVYTEYKNTIQTWLDENISVLAPNEPLHGGKWFVSDVKFLSPSFVLVKYEDGHDLSIVLVQIIKTRNGYDFMVIN